MITCRRAAGWQRSVSRCAYSCILEIRNTNLWNRLQYQICYLMLKQYAPVLTAGRCGTDCYIQIEDETTMYDMQSESQLSYDQILTKKDPQETQTADATVKNSDIF